MSGPAKCAGHRAGVTTVAFHRTAPAQIRKGKLGVYFAWGAFSKRDGEIFVDAHGDDIPDDEFIGAALSLAKSAKLGHEHDGTVNGSVPLVMPLTSDIQAALELSSPHAGLVVGFQPIGELAKSLEAGEPWELSIAGEGIATMAKFAKTADTDAAPTDVAKRRTLTALKINEISLVKAGAHGAGTRIAIAKRAESLPAAEPAPVAKRKPAMTTAVNGHQHSIYDAEELSGGTSHETAPGAPYGHSHPFIRHDDGSISIGAVDGHTHDLATTEDATMADDITKTLSADLAKARKTLADVLALSPAELAYAKRLDEAGVAAFVAKGADERAKLAAPVYVAKSGRAYFAGEEGMVELAKALDEQTAELAKAKEAARVAEFAKSGADKWGHLIGGSIAHTAIAKALATADLTADERKAAESALVAASATVAKLKTPIGVGGESRGPEDEIESIAAEIAKSKGCSHAQAYDLALQTPAGAAAYARAESERKAARN